MFIKSLKIFSKNETIRNISFHSGLNLIVDNTSSSNKIKTGNDVGKTTVLKLIDICFGANINKIYQDTESKKHEDKFVRSFLEENKICVSLELCKDFSGNAFLTIERNFLKYKNAIRKINGENIQEHDFEKKLLNIIFPNQNYTKPTFRQIISHNNRYTEQAVTNTLRTLDAYSKDTDYEALYLFLLGCNFANGEEKQKLVEKKAQEENYKKRIENGKSKTVYETFLTQIENDIQKLNERKKTFGINSEFENDLSSLDDVRYSIDKLTSEINILITRKNLIKDTVEDLEKEKSEMELSQIRHLYNEVKFNLSNIQKTFEELVDYHNKMIISKVKFISSELPSLELQIKTKNNELSVLLNKEKTLANKLTKYDTFLSLEDIISQLNEKYRQKGEYETILNQLDTADETIKQLTTDLTRINDNLFSENFNNELNSRVARFNQIYSRISTELYGEQYVLTCEIKDSKKGKIYDFNSFNTNMSSGKKQGEILCFDIAYILYARQENIPHLDFLLNDKKELLHGNQIEKVASFVKENNIQLVLTILKDKLPPSLVTKENIILELSQDDKLFRIENKNQKNL